MGKIINKKNPSFFFIALFLFFTNAINLLTANPVTFETTGEKRSTLNVRDFGAKGDGVADDTDAINAAVAGAVNGLVVFPRGSYRITKTIDIVLKEHGPIGLSGHGGSARIIMDGDGPAFRFTGTHRGRPITVTPLTWEKERMPLVYNMEIIGNHPDANGLEFCYTMQPVVSAVLIRNVHHGIHLTHRNRNVIITNSHIINNSGVGIYLDSVDIHQIIISNSHISVNHLGGIKVDRSVIRNLHITGNDIEYNNTVYGSENFSRVRHMDSQEYQEGPVSADIWIDCSERGSVREGTIVSNTIQSVPGRDGANILFTGHVGDNKKIGLFSITGNLITSQTVNIYLDHTHGISVTGNTFIRGYDRNMIIDNSRNVIVTANVFDHNKDYVPSGEIYTPGGVTISNSDNLILSDNIIDGVEHEIEGAITVNESREVSLKGNHISNPKYRGIQINQSSNVRVTDCRVYEDVRIPEMLSAIELNGACPGTIIRNNSIMRGKNGDIVNRASGVIIEGNTVDSVE